MAAASACGAGRRLREGCGGRLEGAVSPRRARRDGALRTPQQPDPSAARGTPKKRILNHILVLYPPLASLLGSFAGFMTLGF